MFNYLKQLWTFIEALPNTVKSLIIFIIIGIFLYYGIDNNLEHYIKYIDQKVPLEMQAEEKYAIEMAEPINQCLKEISVKDKDTYDVILLTYHNTKKTMQGFSYIYMDYLTDYKIDPSKPQVKKFFRELDWIYYSDELKTLQDQSYYRCNSLDSLKIKYPKLYYDVFQELNPKALAIYNLQGVDSSLGLLIILYDKPKKYYLGYSNTVIYPYLQQLASILDYNNIKKKVND